MEYKAIQNPEKQVNENPLNSLIWVPCIADYYFGTITPLFTANDFNFTAPSVEIKKKRQTKNFKSLIWTKEEDALLIELVKTCGTKQWSNIGKVISSVSGSGFVIKGKYCRERWYNYLNPDINKGDWTIEEDFLLLSQIQFIGKKWSKIAKVIKGRNENSVKNRWNKLIKNARKIKKFQNLDDFEISEQLMSEVNHSFLNFRN